MLESDEAHHDASVHQVRVQLPDSESLIFDVLPLPAGTFEADHLSGLCSLR